MEYIIFEVLELLVEILVMLLLFQNLITSKKNRMISWALLASVALILSAAFKLGENIAVVDLALSICLVAAFLETQWYKKITIFLLLYPLSSLTYQGFDLIVDSLIPKFNFFKANSISVEIFEKIGTIIILLMILVLKRKKNYTLKLTQPSIIILGIESIIISSFLTAVTWENQKLKQDTLYLLASLSGASILLVFLYLIVASARNVSSEKNEMQMRYIEGLEKYYEELEKNELFMRKIRHDMNNHFQILSNLMANDKIDEVKRYLEQYQDGISMKIKKLPDIGMPSINAIIVQKMNEYPDIKIEYKGAVKEEGKINEYDLCTVLVNLLDNALEYSSQHGFKQIKLGMYQDSNCVLLSVENEVEKGTGIEHLRHTTKKDKENHGLGIDNVRDVADKYKGSLDYSVMGDRLSAVVKLYLN